MHIGNVYIYKDLVHSYLEPISPGWAPGPAKTYKKGGYNTYSTLVLQLVLRSTYKKMAIPIDSLAAIGGRLSAESYPAAENLPNIFVARPTTPI